MFQVILLLFLMKPFQFHKILKMVLKLNVNIFQVINNNIFQDKKVDLI